jgi:hypothetical protein
LNNIKTGAILMASLISMNAPVFAQTASDLLSAIKASKAAGSDNIRITSLHTQTIVTVQSDASLSNEESLKDRAVTIARLVSQDKATKPLTILFNDRANKVKEVSFDTTELTQLAAGSEIMHIALNDADEAVDNISPASSHTVASVSASMAGSKFQSDRTRLAERIDSLRTKGVGVTPFVQELSRIDDLYKHGGVAQASSSLSKLDETLTAQEKYRVEMQATAAHNSRIQPASYSGSAGHVVAAVAAVNASSVADYHGSMDGFVEQMINSAVSKEVGAYMPVKGPFLIERFRIAKRIHELELQRTRVDGYACLWRNMEDVVAAKDPRRLSELNNDVRYLQSQLGLAQLEGRMSKPLGI